MEADRRNLEDKSPLLYSSVIVGVVGAFPLGAQTAHLKDGFESLILKQVPRGGRWAARECRSLQGSDQRDPVARLAVLVGGGCAPFLEVPGRGYQARNWN